MKNSKLIALSAIATALGVIFLALGAFVPLIDYSCIFMASISMMIPLTKKSVWAGFMTYLATALLSLLFIGGRWEMAVTFSIFFGLHPLINYLFFKKRVKRWIGLIIKEVWFIASVMLIYFFFESFIGFENEILRKYAIFILTIGGGILFVAYDFIMIRFQRFMDIAVNRLKL